MVKVPKPEGRRGEVIQFQEMKGGAHTSPLAVFALLKAISGPLSAPSSSWVDWDTSDLWDQPCLTAEPAMYTSCQVSFKRDIFQIKIMIYILFMFQT